MPDLAERTSDVMNHRVLRSTICLAAVLAVGACGNGLPGDLKAHLASRGVAIHPKRAHAPFSQRGGYLVLEHDAQTVSRIAATLNLAKLPIDDRRVQRAVSGIEGPGTVREVWGITGRPAELRLGNGGQLEYLFLVISADGLVYLIAEYAYS